MTDNFNIIKFLRSAVATGASDEHLHVGSAPYVRINGFVKKINMPALTKEDLDDAIVEIAPEGKKSDILNKLDVDFMFEIPECSRFRVNYNRQMNMPGLVIRNIPHNIPDMDALPLIPMELNPKYHFPDLDYVSEMKPLANTEVMSAPVKGLMTILIISPEIFVRE